mmetsp:Transcript_4877/g.12385  ORF Transcript_4877/g.12385 Transcript_4877/m.12385 type:complete len:222 (-) Transcript_4877:304-969(-)
MLSEPCMVDSVLPGECATAAPSAHVLRLGDGLRQESGSLISTSAGTIHTQANGAAWVDFSRRRNIPAAEETVLGIVVETHAEAYTVDIAAPTRATLPVLAFEGATKHNRPKLAVGSLVHARVLTSNSAKEPILTCVDKAGQAGGLGVLDGGYAFQCSTNASRKLLSHPLSLGLEALGGMTAFEIVVGMNGRVWIAAASIADAVIVANTIAGGGVVRCCGGW